MDAARLACRIHFQACGSGVRGPFLHATRHKLPSYFSLIGSPLTAIHASLLASATA